MFGIVQFQKSIAFVFLFCAWVLAVRAQSAVQDTSGTRVFGIPFLFYSPDTRLGTGVLGIVTFPGKPYRSSVSFGLAYTQRKQFLLYLPYQWFSKNQQWRAYGELGWFRYLYQYFGIGNSYSNNFSENYKAEFPRVRVTATHRIKGLHYGGIRWYADNYHIIRTDPAGEIADGNLNGAQGGLTSSIGGVWLFDSRDKQFFPGNGWMLESTLTGEGPWSGGDFKYARLSFDAVRYLTVRKNHKIAINVLTIFSSRGMPFFSLPQLGGPRRLRGYPDGKFRDRNLLLAQAEWRFPIYWRFKGVLFGGAGSVYGTAGENLKIRPNAGVGLRFEFDRKQQLHLRVDYGFGAGKGNSGAYITIGEAF